MKGCHPFPTPFPHTISVSGVYLTAISHTFRPLPVAEPSEDNFWPHFVSSKVEGRQRPWINISHVSKNREPRDETRSPDSSSTAHNNGNDTVKSDKFAWCFAGWIHARLNWTFVCLYAAGAGKVSPPGVAIRNCSVPMYLPSWLRTGWNEGKCASSYRLSVDPGFGLCVGIVVFRGSQLYVKYAATECYRALKLTSCFRGSLTDEIN